MNNFSIEFLDILSKTFLKVNIYNRCCNFMHPLDVRYRTITLSPEKYHEQDIFDSLVGKESKFIICSLDINLDLVFEFMIFKITCRLSLLYYCYLVITLPESLDRGSRFRGVLVTTSSPFTYLATSPL